MKTKSLSIIISATVCLLAMGTASIAVAGPGCPPTTITVTNTLDSGAGSLRQAINDANACSDTNIIEFDAGVTGTITLTSGQLLIAGHVTINGPGADVLSVDGNNATRVFYITNHTVTITGLTIANGNAGVGSGGGIFSEN